MFTDDRSLRKTVCITEPGGADAAMDHLRAFAQRCSLRLPVETCPVKDRIEALKYTREWCEDQTKMLLITEAHMIPKAAALLRYELVLHIIVFCPSNQAEAVVRIEELKSSNTIDDARDAETIQRTIEYEIFVLCGDAGRVQSVKSLEELVQALQFREAKEENEPDGSTSAMVIQQGGSCLTCGSATERRCRRCAAIGLDNYFCSPVCQREGWRQHRKVCAVPLVESSILDSILDFIRPPTPDSPRSRSDVAMDQGEEPIHESSVEDAVVEDKVLQDDCEGGDAADEDDGHGAQPELPTEEHILEGVWDSFVGLFEPAPEPPAEPPPPLSSLLKQAATQN